jgi:hypothetical protein
MQGLLYAVTILKFTIAEVFRLNHYYTRAVAGVWHAQTH